MRLDKKFLSLLLAALMLFAAFSMFSCTGAGALYTYGNGELNVVCTVFPIFDITRNITGENATVTLLQDNGADPHSYSPTAAALKAVGEADIFIYIGGPSEEKWVDDMILSSQNKSLVTVNISEHIEHIVPEASCSGTHEHEHDHADGNYYDEHFWTSPKNAVKIAEVIKSALCSSSSEYKTDFEKSCTEYIDKLNTICTDYENAFKNAKVSMLVFADRFPFAYLLNDYSFAYTAAFSGCSAETDSSYETLDKISEAVSKNSLSYVLTIEGSDKKLARTVSEQTDCKILTVNSLQSVNRTQIENGLTYIDTMRENLTVFSEALGINQN